MRYLSGRISLLLGLPWLAACSSTRPPPNTVVMQYQHVANAHQIRFAAPLALAPAPARYVLPRDRQGFWAIFVLCSLDVTARQLPSFVYDVNNFRVSYRGKEYGAVTPYAVRYEDSAWLNKPVDTPALASAIAGELQEGPTLQVFGRGYYPALNYRFALFVPRAPDEYAGEQLTLAYAGHPAILVGNGHPPYDIEVVGGDGTGVAAGCLP